MLKCDPQYMHGVDTGGGGGGIWELNNPQDFQALLCIYWKQLLTCIKI